MTVAEPLEDVGKRARVKAANRRAILDAARAVFAEMGYEGATVRDIIRRTELASGTFYNYFKSKEEVFQALTADSIARFRPRLAELRRRACSFEAYIGGAFYAYFDFIAEENRRGTTPGVSGRALAGGVRVDPPEMRAVFDEIRDDIQRALADTPLRHLDADYLTAAAVGVARELSMHMLERDPVDVKGAARFATDMFMKGVERISP